MLTLRARGAALPMTLGILLAVAGCSTPAPEPSSSPVASASATTESVFASEEEALAAATEAYEQFVAYSDEQLTTGADRSKELLTVITPSLVDLERQGLSELNSNSWRQVGTTSIDSVTLQSYSANALEDHEVITMYFCVDLSSVDLLDKDGNSVVAPARQDRTPYEARFVRSMSGKFGIKLASHDPWSGANFC